MCIRDRDAKACYKMNRLVLVNLDILDEYLETFHIEDEEFYKSCLLYTSHPLPDEQVVHT